jgi:hypothetical protein
MNTRLGTGLKVRKGDEPLGLCPYCEGTGIHTEAGGASCEPCPPCGRTGVLTEREWNDWLALWSEPSLTLSE